MVDLNAKLADAKIQAAAAQSKVSALTPDGGDKAKTDTNRTALVGARADLKVGTEDLQSARKDIEKVQAGLKALHVEVTATSSSTQ